MVVHLDHGIGRYQGIRKLGEGETAREFMVLIYRKEAVLYVPVDRLDLVQKYSGVGGKLPVGRGGAGGHDPHVEQYAVAAIELDQRRGAGDGARREVDAEGHSQVDLADRRYIASTFHRC